MGQGQPQRNRQGQNFMNQVGLGQDPYQVGTHGGQTVSGPVNQSQLNVQQQAPQAPFSGQGQGWRGLDINPVNNTGRNNFSGFNMDRAMAGGDPKSTKDAFSRWAAGFNQDIRNLDKSRGGQLEQVMRSRLDDARRMGLNIQDIQGDKILIDAYENPGQFNWVDVVQNAGADAAWAWQPDVIPQASPANAFYDAYQNQLAPPAQSDNLEELLIMMMNQNQELI